MDLLNNLTWYFHLHPKNAYNILTTLPITEKEMKTIVYFGKSMTLSLPLNDDFLFLESRVLTSPFTVENVLTTIFEFYQEPLKEEDFNNAFEGSLEWKDEVIDTKYDGDISQLIKYDVFTDTCTPDFCGLEYNKETDEYFVSIGPI